MKRRKLNPKIKLLMQGIGAIILGIIGAIAFIALFLWAALEYSYKITPVTQAEITAMEEAYK